MSRTIERIADYRLRCTVREPSGAITDIYEGPERFILDLVVRHFDSTAELGVRRTRPRRRPYVPPAVPTRGLRS